MQDIVLVEPNSCLIIQVACVPAEQGGKISQVHHQEANPDHDHIPVQPVPFFMVMKNVQNKHEQEIDPNERHEPIV